MKKGLVFALVLTTLPLMYNACGQTPFGPMGFQLDQASLDMGLREENISKNPYALLSAEQVLKSFSSVTKVAINGPIMNEYNARNTILSPNNDLKQSTAPMLVAISNLAGQFCEETLNQEVGMAAASRRFYNNVDFSRNIASVGDAQFVDAVNRLGLSFWGRAPGADELSLLQAARTEFLNALNTTERNATASSRNLMLFTCTGMLASFDSYTF